MLLFLKKFFGSVDLKVWKLSLTTNFVFPLFKYLTYEPGLWQYEPNKRLPTQSQQLEQSLKYVHVNTKGSRTTLEYR